MIRVLVIDDEEAIRLAIVDLLELHGFEAISAANGLAGVQAARQHLPDLIVCDIMMPHLDGFGVLDELRGDPVLATIPFVFLTAKAQKEDLRRGMELGADDYVTKPFTREELIRAIETRLAKRETALRHFQLKLDDLRHSITLSLPHELRTPLTGILTSSIVLKDELADLDESGIQSLVRIIHTSAQRLERLVMNYLLYAELVVMATQPETVQALRYSLTDSAQAFVPDAAQRAARKAKRDADLSLDVCREPVQIMETHLWKIVEELVDNACKFSAAGTPIAVTARVEDGLFTLSVLDKGRGMTAAQIADVGAHMQFERRIHEQQGSGLGLAISLRLAELYGGALTIESEPNQFTLVRVALPARADAS